MKKKIFLQATLFLVVIVVVCACARTKMSSFVDPVYRPSSTYTKIMVFGKDIPLDERILAEDKLVATFNDAGVTAIRSLDHLPPTQTFTDDEIASTIIGSGAEAVLILGLTGRDVSQSYMPQTYFPGTSTTTTTYMGSYSYSNTYTSPGYTTGGYNVNKPVASYHLSLIDVKSGKTVWVADAKSGGNAFATFGDLTESAARTAVEQLYDDGLIEKHPRSVRVQELKKPSSDKVGVP